MPQAHHAHQSAYHSLLTGHLGMARKPLPLLSLVMVTVLLLCPENVPRRDLRTLEQTTGREGDSSSDNRVGVRDW